MVEQESQTDKLSSELNFKTNENSKSLEFNTIELNHLLKIIMFYNYDLWNLPTKLTFFLI